MGNYKVFCSCVVFRVCMYIYICYESQLLHMADNDEINIQRFCIRIFRIRVVGGVIRRLLASSPRCL